MSRWKNSELSPWKAVAALGGSCGLLVDFQGATTKMTQVIPIVGAFLPIVAISVTILSIGWVVVTMQSAIRRMLPSGRFYVLHEDIEEVLDALLVDVSIRRDYISAKTEVKMLRLRDRLNALGVPSPVLDTKQWYNLAPPPSC